MLFWTTFHRDSMHYNDVIMGAIVSQITSLTIVYSIVYSDAHQRKHQSSASLAFVRGIHGWPVNSPHKWPVTRKMFPFDDVIMGILLLLQVSHTLSGPVTPVSVWLYIDGLVQNCNISSALAIGILQPCTKPSIHLCHKITAKCLVLL